MNECHVFLEMLLHLAMVLDKIKLSQLNNTGLLGLIPFPIIYQLKLIIFVYETLIIECLDIQEPGKWVLDLKRNCLDFHFELCPFLSSDLYKMLEKRITNI